MKRNFHFTALLLVLCVICYAQITPTTSPKSATQRAEFERLQTKNLQTGKIPIDGRSKALERVEQQNNTMNARSSSPNVVNQPRWLEIGPTDIGGRVRSLLLTSINTGFVGGISGGLWKGQGLSVPTNADWQKISDRFKNLNITSLALDPTDATNKTIYFATGEGNLSPADYLGADLTSASYGGGIWKTTDGGLIWKKLPAGNFHYINKIVVANNGDLFAATGHKTANNSQTELEDSTGILILKVGTTKFKKILSNTAGRTTDWGIDLERAANGDIFATAGCWVQTPSTTGNIYKISLAGGVWTPTLLTNTQLPAGVTIGRIEIACAKSNAAVLYAAYERTDSGKVNVLQRIYKSVNSGATWTKCALIPNNGVGSALFYYMALEVHPTDPNKVLFGAENVFRTISGGAAWVKLSTEKNTVINHGNKSYMHPDHHQIIWYSDNVAYFVNDGGIWRSGNVSGVQPTFDSLNTNLNITQFYSVGASPTANTFNLIGGTQDNTSLYLTNASTHTTAIEASGGDGGYAFYSPITSAGTAMQDVMFTSYTYNQYYRFKAPNTKVGVGYYGCTNCNPQGLFINPTEVIWTNNDALLVAGSVPDSIAFYPNVGTTANWTNPIIRYINLSRPGLLKQQVAFIKKSPTLGTAIANVIYVGTTGGRLLKVTFNNAHVITSSVYMNTVDLPSGFISSIDVRGANDAEIVVTFSNYGEKSVWYTANANAANPLNIVWTALDVNDNTGRLLDIPVWYALFAPVNPNIKLLIGTELGVYTTNAYNGTATFWEKDNNSPITRVNQIKYRSSDNMLFMATYGRGLWRSDMFSTYQQWFGSDQATIGSDCALIFRDSSTANYLGTRWYLFNNNVITGTNSEITFPKCNGLTEWSWIRMDKQLPTGEWVSQKRRAGEMLKIQGAPCACVNPRLSNPNIVERDFTIYPNPNNGNEFSIKVDNRLFTEDEVEKTEKHLTIYNIQGQIVFYKKLNALNETVELDAPLTNGFYFVEFRGGNIRLTEKLTIIK